MISEWWKDRLPKETLSFVLPAKTGIHLVLRISYQVLTTKYQILSRKGTTDGI